MLLKNELWLPIGPGWGGGSGAHTQYCCLPSLLKIRSELIWVNTLKACRMDGGRHWARRYHIIAWSERARISSERFPSFLIDPQIVMSISCALAMHELYEP